MAKSSKKKKTQEITTDSIYDMLREGKILEDLWLELISDLKEKPTYKKMKAMVADVFSEKLQSYTQKPPDSVTRGKIRAELAEISILAYTVDLVLTEFLRKKLDNEFKELTVDMIAEFQNKKTETKPVDKKPSFHVHSMLENIESIFTEKLANGTVKVAKDPESSINQLMAQSFVPKRGRPRKTAAPVEKDSHSPLKDKYDDNISVGSVSSVQTDDLSSYDETVNLEGVAGTKLKKKISIQKAKKLMAEGKLSSKIFHQEKKNADKTKKSTQNKKAPPKILPKRKRKPNSKYNPETMFCNVKDYSSDRSSSSETAENVANIPSHTEPKTKKMKTNNFEVKKRTVNGTPIKTEIRTIPSPNVVSTRSASGSSSSDKSSSEDSQSASPTKMLTAQRYDPSDLYKPRFHFGKS